MHFTEFATVGVSVLADFSRDTAMAAGLSATRVRDLARVHAFYGPTQFTRKQHDALTAAAEGMLDDQLVHIGKSSYTAKAQPSAGASA